MLVGILSDTHGRNDAMSIGIKLLRDSGAELFLHCGDIGGQPCIDLLAGLNASFVWGNTDWDRKSLSGYAQSIGVNCMGVTGEIELGDDRRLVMTHGDDARLKRQLLDAQRYDYFLQGHTHVRLDERVGRTRVINPGALHRAAEKTVALLDSGADSVRFIVVA
jgi:putative phosphoesterase